MMDTWLNKVHVGDCRTLMREMPEKSVHCVATSPPYWGLRVYDGCPESVWGGDTDCQHQWAEDGGGPVERDRQHLAELGERLGCGGGKKHSKGKQYGGNNRNGIGGSLGGEGRKPNNPDISAASATCTKCGAWRGMLGLEPKVDDFIEHLMLVMDAVWRVMRDDGVCFVNLGDSYYGGKGKSNLGWASEHIDDRKTLQKDYHHTAGHGQTRPLDLPPSVTGMKPKSLCLVPQRFAIAAQARGWIVRSEIIWRKANPMPESVTDRPTKSHETVWLLTKGPRYFWDAQAVRENGVCPAGTKAAKGSAERSAEPGVNSRPPEYKVYNGTRNARDVLNIATAPYKEAHFATWPPKLARWMILAGSSPKCCEKCGAPWVRVVEKEQATDGRPEAGPRLYNYRGRLGHQAKAPSGLVVNVTTTGWTPTCKCEFFSLKSGVPVPIMDELRELGLL